MCVVFFTLIILQFRAAVTEDGYFLVKRIPQAILAIRFGAFTLSDAKQPKFDIIDRLRKVNWNR